MVLMVQFFLTRLHCIFHHLCCYQLALHSSILNNFLLSPPHKKTYKRSLRTYTFSNPKIVFANRKYDQSPPTWASTTVTLSQSVNHPPSEPPQLWQCHNRSITHHLSIQICDIVTIDQSTPTWASRSVTLSSAILSLVWLFLYSLRYLE